MVWKALAGTFSPTWARRGRRRRSISLILTRYDVGPHTKRYPELLISRSQLLVSRFELNQQLKDGKTVEEYAPTEKKQIIAGSAGSQWRMMKLRKVYEQAEEE